MNCPECEKTMKCKHGTGLHIDFSGTAEEDELTFYWIKYTCKTCHISYNGTDWTIPDDKQPTDKQKNTILFINNRLHTDLEALTKRQCWRDINRYFNKAKQTPLHSDEYYEEIQEYMSESDFF